MHEYFGLGGRQLMYDATKREEMLQNGFWPIRELKDGKEVERMATALGNLLYRTFLFELFSLSHGEIHGDIPGIIIIFDADE